jgi:hypothetical protein
MALNAFLCREYGWTHDYVMDLHDRLREAYARDALAERAHQGKTPMIDPATPGAPLQPDRMYRHSEDFATVYWWGAEYHFTGNQAAAVAKLWEAWANGTPVIRQETATAATESRRLVDVFKCKGRGMHDAWGTMIIPGPLKGTYRLQGPPAKKTPKKSRPPRKSPRSPHRGRHGR